MGMYKKKIILSVITLSILINPVNGQDYYYYGDSKYMFSEHLKTGMEFTWEFKKFSFEFINSSLDLNQVTSTASETVTEEQTTTTVYYDPPPQTTTETSEEYYIEFPEIPDVPVGTLYTIKLLKDIGNLTEDYLYGVYEEDVESYYAEYFEFSTSLDDANDDIIPFFGVNGFIYPAVIEFENGTRMNAFEYQYQQYSEINTADYDYISDTEVSIVDGVYIEKSGFSEYNITSNSIQQTDVNTGILISVVGSVITPEFRYEVDVELYNTKNIDLNNLDPNETLSLPISAVFVYTLFLIPIFLSKIKSKRDN